MISRESTVLEILEKYPETRAVFDSYDSQHGVCISCKNLFCTVEEVAAANGLPLERLLEDLRKAAGLSF